MFFFFDRTFFRLPEGLAPSFIGKPTIKQDGKTATVQIDISADPCPSLHWSKDGKDLLNVDKVVTRLERTGPTKYTVYLDIKVRFFSVVHSDFKYFFCLPSTEFNQFGRWPLQNYLIE